MNSSDINGGEAQEVGDGRSEPTMSEPDAAGLRMVDILALPNPLRETINWMMRKREVALADLADRLGQDEVTAQSTAADMVQKGFLWETRVAGETYYRVRLAPQRKRQNLALDI